MFGASKRQIPKFGSYLAFGSISGFLRLVAASQKLSLQRANSILAFGKIFAFWSMFSFSAAEISRSYLFFVAAIFLWLNDCGYVCTINILLLLFSTKNVFSTKQFFRTAKIAMKQAAKVCIVLWIVTFVGAFAANKNFF